MAGGGRRDSSRSLPCPNPNSINAPSYKIRGYGSCTGSCERGSENSFTDEAGVALAAALTVKKTLRGIILSVDTQDTISILARMREMLGAPAYEAFSAMLRVNTNLILRLPPFENALANERLLDSHNQMRIEQGLNGVGRGRLLTSSNHTTREDWVNALEELNLNSSSDNDPPEFNVSCLYSLLRLNRQLLNALANSTKLPIMFLTTS